MEKQRSPFAKARRALCGTFLSLAVVAPSGAAFAAIAPSGADTAGSPGCGAGLPAIGERIGYPAVTLTKSAAILGGGQSALDAIRSQQQFAPLSASGQGSLLASMAHFTITLPGIDTSLAPSATCETFAAAAVRPSDAGRGGQIASIFGRDDFLASQRVRIRHTAYDTEWRRVRTEAFSRSAVQRLVGIPTSGAEASLAAVNGFVNRRIKFTEDRALFGQSDYWAGAKRTLRLGKGDCEDIALLKMQLLAGAGVSREDMFLTITRDLARNQDHTVLIVRTGSGYRMLDDSTDSVLDAAPKHDYRAIISLGYRENWLHGA